MCANRANRAVRELAVRELAETGPLTGHELLTRLGGDAFDLWHTCFSDPQLTTLRVGRRYVRLDRQVEGFARLSPSILREFLTYTVVGLAGDSAIRDRAGELQHHIADVSRHKRALSRQIVRSVGAEFTAAGREDDRFCVVIAGDIVYGMAHDVLRPERSTGNMVHGSDLDLVVIVDDDADHLVPLLDAAIYSRKFQYLKHPAYCEEIDYVVKPYRKLVEQAAFDTFPRMVACKIFHEAELLYGSQVLFQRGKDLLRQRGIVGRLEELEAEAVRDRENQVQALLASDTLPQGNQRFHFSTDDEAPEFE